MSGIPQASVQESEPIATKRMNEMGNERMQVPPSTADLPSLFFFSIRPVNLQALPNDSLY